MIAIIISCNQFGLGAYNLFCVSDKYKDELLKYFKTIYYPEFAIPNFLITNDMIVGIDNQKRMVRMYT